MELQTETIDDRRLALAGAPIPAQPICRSSDCRGSWKTHGEPRPYGVKNKSLRVLLVCSAAGTAASGSAAAWRITRKTLAALVAGTLTTSSLHGPGRFGAAVPTNRQLSRLRECALTIGARRSCWAVHSSVEVLSNDVSTLRCCSSVLSISELSRTALPRSKKTLSKKNSTFFDKLHGISAVIIGPVAVTGPIAFS